MKSIRHAVKIAPETAQETGVENSMQETVQVLESEPVKKTRTPRPKKNYSKYVKSMLSDSQDDNAISSKRVITLLAFIFCSIAFFANLFFGYKIDEFIFNTMAYIVLGGFGVTGLEKFASNNVVLKQEDTDKSRWE